MEYLRFGLLLVLFFVFNGVGALASVCAFGLSIMYVNPLYMLLCLVTVVCIAAAAKIYDEL
jgi:hypothetical protein